MNLKQLFADDDSGVSPVIGVILMVAITVILAAVIGTFVLNLGESVSTKATAGVTTADGDYNVTLNSLGPGADGIKCSNTGTQVTTVGEVLNCESTDNSVVAFGADVDDAVVHEFD